MKIAYIVTTASPIGGAQIHVRDLAAAVAAQGHAPSVITSGSGTFIDDLRRLGIPVRVMQHLAVPIHPIRDLRALQEVRRALAELQPDLIHAHSSKAGMLARLAGRSLRVPVVFTVHGWAFTPGVPALQAAVYRQAERLVGPLATKIIAVSEFDRQLGMQARIAPADRMVTVHNGMPDQTDVERADPTRAPVRMVMIARFGAQKDHPTLFRALAELKTQPWTLDLIGDGPLMDEAKALAAALDLGERLRFLGQRNDVDRILADSQISLLVTNWEGFPLSILESMRAGLPVVASDVGGINESVEDGVTGYLVPRGDVGRVRDRIAELLASAELRGRLGANGLARFQREFTLERSVARTVAVYRQVVENDGR